MELPPTPPAPPVTSPPPASAKPRRRWRFLAGFLIFLGGLVGLLAIVVLGAGIWARTDGGRAWILAKLLGLVGPVNGTLTAASLETDLYSRAVVRDITLADSAGATIGHVDSLGVTYRLGGLPGRILLVPTVRIEGLDLTLTQSSAGLDIATLWDDGSPPSGKPWTGVGIDLVFPDVAITDANVRYRQLDDAGTVVGEYGFDAGALVAAVELRGPAVLVRGLELDAPTTLPALGPLSLGSDMRWDPSTLWFERLDAGVGANTTTLAGGIGRLDGEATLGVQIVTLHVDTDSLAPLLGGGALPVTGVFDATGGVAGLLRAPTALLELRTPGGTAHASAALDMRGPRAVWSGSLALDAVALHTFLRDVPAPLVLGGALSVEGRGFGWPDDLDADATYALTSPALPGVDLRAGETLIARGTAHLAKGVVDIPDVRLDGPGMGVAGAATVRILDTSGDARLDTVVLDLARLDRFGAPGGRGRVTFAGTSRFGWAERTGFSAVGDLRGREVGWAEIADAGTVAGPVKATWTPDRGVSVVASLSLEAISSRAAAGYAATSGTVDGTVVIATGGGLSVDAAATIAGVAGPDVTLDSIGVAGSVSRSSAGRLDGSAELVTGPLVAAGIVSDRGVGHVGLSGEVATVKLDLWDGERTVVGVDGEADIGARSARARRLVLSPDPDVTFVGEGVQSGRLVDGGVADVKLRLVADTSVISASGHVRRDGPVNLTVEARDARLDWLAAIWPARFAGYAGRVDLRASMEGRADEPTLYVDVAAVGLTIPDAVTALDLDVQAEGADDRLQVEGLIRSGADALARVTGDLPFSLDLDAPGLVTSEEIDLTILLPAVDSARWNAVLPSVALPVFRGSAELSVSGPVLDPRLKLVAAVSAPGGQRSEWVHVDLDGETADGLFQLRAVVRERLERRAEVDGTIALHIRDVVRSVLGEGPKVDLAEPGTWVGALELDVVPLRLPVQALSTFVAIPATLLGDLSGGLHVSGQARAPRLEGALFLSGGRLGDLPLSPALVSLLPAEGGYQVDANLGFGGPSAATVTGFIPFAPTVVTDLSAELKRPGLSLTFSAADVPLKAVGAAWPTLTAYAGTLGAAGTLTGSLADPVPDITFGLADGDFALDVTGVRYRDAAFTGSLGKDELRVEGLTVRTARTGALATKTRATDRAAEGRVTGAVTAHRVGNRAVFDSEIVFDRAWIVDLPNQVLRTDGQLRLSERDEKFRVVGKLSVVEGQLVVPERFFSGARDLQLDSDIRVIRAGAEPGSEEAVLEEERAAAAEEPLMPTWLDLEVAVDLERNVFLDASLPLEQRLGETLKSFSSIEVSNTQLDGTLLVAVRNGDLSLVGQILPLRGTASVFSVPFELAGETISFTGYDYTEPVLDLEAVHETAEYGSISTHITGTPSSLAIDFSSDNPDLAQEDLLAVLLLGRPPSEMDAGEGEAAGDLIGAALSTFANSVVQNQFTASRAFDVLEVDVTGSVRAGRRVPGTDNMFLLGEYNWNADPIEENIGEVTLEVRLGRAWQFDFTTGTSGISSVGLTRKWRF